MIKRKKNKGFSLVEILIALIVLMVGLVGILALFPVALNSTKRSIEETYAAMVADYAYNKLRICVRRAEPGEYLYFNIYKENTEDDTNIKNDNKDKAYPGNNTNLTLENLRGKAFFIPGPHKEINDNDNVYEINNDGSVDYKLTEGGYVKDLKDFATIGIDAFNDTNLNDFIKNNGTPGIITQFRYNIELRYPNEANRPLGLFDVIIRVVRNKKLIKKFYSKIYIPLQK